MNLRASIMLNDNKVVVDEVECGEEHIKARFKHAVKASDVSPVAVPFIRVVYASVRSGYVQMRDIKKTMKALDLSSGLEKIGVHESSRPWLLRRSLLIAGTASAANNPYSSVQSILM